MKNKVATIIISILIIIFGINCVWSISDLCNTKDAYNLKIVQAEELDVIKNRRKTLITTADYYYKVYDDNNELYIIKADKSWFEKNFRTSGKAKNDYVEIKGLARQIGEFDNENGLYVKLTGNKDDKDKIKYIDATYEKSSIIKLAIGGLFIILCTAGILNNKRLEKKEQKSKSNNENQRINNPVSSNVKPNLNYVSEPKELNKFYNEKLEKVANLVKKHTVRDSYNMELLKERTSLYDSKLGGIPYWDLSKEYPVDKNGEKLILLVQINLEKENLESSELPNTGILQFFVENKFCCSDKEINKVIYHKTINRNVTEDEIKRLNIPTTLDAGIDITIKGEYKLAFKKVKESISIYDYRFVEVLENSYNKLFETNDFEEVYNEWVEDGVLYDKFSDGKGHKLLGFPHFCQEDPRSTIIYNASQSNVKLATSLNENGNKTMSWFPSASDMNKIKEENEKAKEIPNFDMLLLQIDSCGEFVWGDNGQVNIFINFKDLKDMKFSKVLWNFDCY